MKSDHDRVLWLQKFVADRQQTKNNEPAGEPEAHSSRTDKLILLGSTAFAVFGLTAAALSG